MSCLIGSKQPRRNQWMGGGRRRSLGPVGEAAGSLGVSAPLPVTPLAGAAFCSSSGEATWLEEARSRTHAHIQTRARTHTQTHGWGDASYSDWKRHLRGLSSEVHHLERNVSISVRQRGGGYTDFKTSASLPPCPPPTSPLRLRAGICAAP